MCLVKVNECERISIEEVLNHTWMRWDEQTNDSNLHRTNSEETIVDDAIVINDEEFKNENRDETRSIDDSSSGIVMSDRNEGSSVSHEEIDPSGHIMFENNEEEMVASVVDEEQIEPENLSLKNSKVEDKLPDDESITVVIPEESTIEESKNKRAPKKPRARVTKQKPIKQHETPEISPLDLINQNYDPFPGLPLNLVVQTENEFFGFDASEIEMDNNFPLFGFTSDDNATSESLKIFYPLYNSIKEMSEPKRKKVLNVGKAQRKRKEKNCRGIQGQIYLSQVENMEELSTNATSSMNIRKNKRAAKLEVVPAQLSRPVRSCRMLKETPKTLIELQITQFEKAEEPIRIQKGRAIKHTNIMTENIVPAKRTRKAIKQEITDDPSAVIVHINEVVKNPRNRKKKVDEPVVEMTKPTGRRGQKRKIELEPPKIAAAEKPKKTVMVKKELMQKEATVRSNKGRKDISYAISKPSIPERGSFRKNIKLEAIPPPPPPPSTVISYFQRPIQALSPKFKERLNSIKTWYIDNKQQPSLMSNSIKPESAEKSAINITSLPIKIQHR